MHCIHAVHCFCLSLVLRPTYYFIGSHTLVQAYLVSLQILSTYPTHSPLTFLNKRNNRKRDSPFPCPGCVWKVVQLYGGGKEGDWGSPSFTRGYKGPWQKRGGNSPQRVFPNNTECRHAAIFLLSGAVTVWFSGKVENLCSLYTFLPQKASLWCSNSNSKMSLSLFWPRIK